MTEADIQSQIMLAIGADPDCRVFRNTVGFGYQGEVVSRARDTITIKHPRPVTFGLGPGSTDIVGWRRVLVTPDMVGRNIGQFFGLEVKTAIGAVSAAQVAFGNTARRFGCCVGVTRTPAEAVALLRSTIT